MQHRASPVQSDACLLQCSVRTSVQVEDEEVLQVAAWRVDDEALSRIPG